VSALRRFVLLLFNALRPGRAEPDLAREIAAHLALLEDEHRRRGLTPDDARLAARRAFDGVELTKDRHRDARAFVWLDQLRQDVRYAMRSFARNPGFTGVAVLTLALGIGANTAIFSVVDAVLLRPLPYPHADQLVLPYEDVPAAESPEHRAFRDEGIDLREFLEVRARAHAFSHVAAYGIALVTVAGSADSVREEIVPVTANTFPMLGIRPLLGRWLDVSDEAPGTRVVVLSYGAWLRYFGGDADAVGRTLTFNGDRFAGSIALGERYTVVGIMPQGFHYPNDQAWLWTTLVPRLPADARPRRLLMIARLADGVTPDVASDEVATIASGIRLATGRPGYADGHRPRFDFVRWQERIGTPVRTALLVLAGAVGLVLLIACVNVANLQLTRTLARQREMAVRAALGAGRGRLIRQLLTESVLLSLTGGAAGLTLAWGCIDVFRALATSLPRQDLGTTLTSFPRLDAVGLHGPVLAFAVAISAATGVAFGLAPAFGLRAESAGRLREATATRTGWSSTSLRGRLSLPGVLVVAEVAFATLLFVGAGLMIRSVVKLENVEPGYDPSRVMTFQVSLPGAQRPAPQMKAFAEDLTSRLRSVAGVRNAAYSNQLPFVGMRDTAGGLWRTPDPVRPPTPGGPDARLVSRDYLTVMGVRIVAGRGFGDDDRDGRPRVLLINETLARRDFADVNPIGLPVFIGRDVTAWTIAGIVADLRQFRLDRDPEPQFFVDLRQWPVSPLTLPVGAYYSVRTEGDPAAVVAGVRGLVRSIDANATLVNVASMDQIVANSITRPRLYAVLVGIFAGVAVLLAAAGIFGVIAYAVEQRTREIGVRMALGARPGQVLGLVLGQSATLTAIGLALGLGGAAMLTRYMETLLFGLTPLDPATFTGVALVFAGVAMLASYVPARRATKVDPLIALRCE
jgi:putative ABC transport system permease protein